MSTNKNRHKNDFKNSDFDEFKPEEFEKFHKETEKHKDKTNKPIRGGKRGN
jgi:hypothetical protein